MHALWMLPIRRLLVPYIIAFAQKQVAKHTETKAECIDNGEPSTCCRTRVPPSAINQCQSDFRDGYKTEKERKKERETEKERERASKREKKPKPINSRCNSQYPYKWNPLWNINENKGNAWLNLFSLYRFHFVLWVVTSHPFFCTPCVCNMNRDYGPN